MCAFGGNCNPSEYAAKKKDTSKNSIFRLKRENSIEKDELDSDESEKAKYEESLSGRYFENDNRISWEIEENPPVEVSRKTTYSSNHGNDSPSMKRKSPTPSLEDKTPTPTKRNKVGNFGDSRSSPSLGSGGDQPKMRYRCKLCGQPKQNHTCPYQQSLQRNIGIMVYPAVNSYTALEPGYLAPALSEMNNFINGSDSMYPSENTPSRPSPQRLLVKKPFSATPSSLVLPHVTPESMRSTQSLRAHGKSTDSIASTENASPHTPFHRPAHYGQYPMNMVRRPTPMSIRRKTSLSPEASSVVSKDSHTNRLYMEKCDLRPEQYRIVSVSTQSSTAYKYPSLPLPYTQRKNFSDNLFNLSKQVPQLTDECASVLRQARKQDKWDIAVAELLTQVIVVVHCPEKDSKLDGLSKYLLKLGFAC